MLRTPKAGQVNEVLRGDALRVLRELPSSCVDTCVTSPPYEAALSLGRHFIGIELNPAYVDLARRRIASLIQEPSEQAKRVG